MTEFEKIVFKDFLSEHWNLFLNFCEQRCSSKDEAEEFAEEIIKALEES